MVLNACQSGAMSEAAEAAVATRLLLEGAASVVAMGYSVYAVAAAEFMAAFYQALFEGKTVSAAVQAGRSRLARKAERPSPRGPLPLADWMVPVHYLRRAIAFTQLTPAPARPGLSLDAALDQMGRAREPGSIAAAAAAAGVPAAGSIEAEGRFVGRDSFLYTLERACRHQRVVLVHGPGGTGKTELAKAFGRWWRDTGGVDDPGYVLLHAFEPGLPSFNLDGRDQRARHPAVRAGLHRPHRRRGAASRAAAADAAAAPHAADLGQLRERLQPVRAGRGDAAAVGGAARRDRRLPGGVPRRGLRLGGDPHQPDARGVAGGGPPGGAGRAGAAGGGGVRRRSARRLPAGAGATPGEGVRRTDGVARWPSAQPAADAAAAGADAGGGAARRTARDGRAAGRVRSGGGAAAVAGGVGEVLARPSARTGHPAAAGAGAVRGGRRRGRAGDVLGRLRRSGAVRRPVERRVAGGAAGDGAGGAADAARRWAVRRASGAAGVSGGAVAGRGGRGLRRRAAGGAAGVAERLCRLRRLARSADQSGSAETALALLERQRRTMGQLLALALGDGLYAEAQAILQPLNAFWDARGLSEEANGWVDRVRQAIEGAGGAAPDFASAAGALWLFAVGSAANRAIRSPATSPAPSRRTRPSAARWRQRRRANNATAGWPASTTSSAWWRRTAAISPPPRRGTRSRWRSSRRSATARGWRASYHQLGIVAQDRGDLAAAEAWYQKSLAIDEALGDRPGMAKQLPPARHGGAGPRRSRRRRGVVPEVAGDQRGARRPPGHGEELPPARRDRASAMQAMAEAFTFGEKQGLERAQLSKLFAETLFDCPVYRNYGQAIADQVYRPAGPAFGYLSD